MNENEKIFFDNSNVLEIHYWLKNNSHKMDALIENRCEHEVLYLIKEIAKTYALSILIETEPTAEGGLRKWFTIVSKEENKKGTITTTIIVALITVLLTTPIAKVSEKLIDKLFEDTEMKEMQKEKLKLEIGKLKEEAIKRNSKIESNNIIKKRKSNFYENLEGYSEIEKVSFLATNENKENIFSEKTIFKNEFKNFILVTDDLSPIEIESANIEIISPVLKKGKYKWMGYFSGEPIIFSMQSTEFKTIVQNGDIEFKNGSSINCFLKIKRQIDNEGIEKIIGYEVIRVNHYFENEKPIETKEGKKHRQTKEAQKNQINLLDDLGLAISEK